MKNSCYAKCYVLQLHNITLYCLNQRVPSLGFVRSMPVDSNLRKTSAYFYKGVHRICTFLLGDTTAKMVKNLRFEINFTFYSFTQNLDPNCPMETSSERGTPDRGDDVDLGTYVDRKLLGSVFSGSYTDRCWIDALQSYRDRLQVKVQLTYIKNLGLIVEMEMVDIL